MKVVCVGDCGIDHYLPDNRRHIGGITANVARHARDLFPADDTVTIVSCLGDDAAGAQVQAAFQDSGIECLWERRHGSTPVQYIEVQSDGERRFVRYNAGVLPEFRFSASQLTAIRTSDLLVAPVYLQIAELFERLMAVPVQGTVAIDFADFLDHPEFGLLERHLEQIDIAFFGLTADRTSIIDHLTGFARRHDTLFVVTLGPSGSLVLQGDTRYECPAQPVSQVADTTGAGDAYAAAFLAGRCRGLALGEVMRGAARVAAEVIGRSGSYATPMLTQGRPRPF